MPHVPEKGFTETVEAWLHERFGEENVESDAYLEATGRFSDYRVDAGYAVFHVEVENDFEAAFKGLGQSLVYAAHDPVSIPMLILPEGHVEEPEWSMICRHVVGVTIPPPPSR